MTDALHALLDLLDLEPLEHNIYRGTNRDIGSGRVYGGQVLAQALVAAARTVDPERICHSLHGYFILPGDMSAPIVYFVDRLRDGRSFTTRRVTAIQHGRAIFSMSTSFHVVEDGWDHQAVMPDVPAPESLPREIDLIRGMADRIPEPLRAVYTQDRPIDFRPIDPVDPFDPERRDPVQYLWLRSEGEMPDDPVQHQALLAYASDYRLLATSLHPHRAWVQGSAVQAASLDHSLWFHRPVRVDGWMLYAMDSPTAVGARGFSRGTIYGQDGTLVASTAQEGLIRRRVPGATRPDRDAK